MKPKAGHYKQFGLESDIPINSQAKERMGYPTQKPLALLERIIKASSNEGDVVLDPFCGCATALVAAEKLEREWVGIDISPKARELVKLRMGKELGLFSLRTVYRDDVPMRTDLGELPPLQDAQAHAVWETGRALRGVQARFPVSQLHR